MSDASAAVHVSPTGSPGEEPRVMRAPLCGEHIRGVTVTLDHLDAALTSLLSTNNTARVEAEGYFASLGDDPRLITALLLRLQDPAQLEGVQQLAAVLLANRIAAVWRRMTLVEQATTQASILSCLANATSRALLRAIASLANVVAQSSVLERPWDSLLPALEHAAASPIESHREAAMTLLGELTESLGLRLQPHYPCLQALFIAGVRDPALSVRKAALGAMTALSSSWCLEQQDVARLAQALLIIVDVARAAWGVGDMETLAEALAALACAAEASRGSLSTLDPTSPGCVVGPMTEVALHAAGNVELGQAVRMQAFNTLRALGVGHATAMGLPYPPLSGSAPLCSVVLPSLCALASSSAPERGAESGSPGGWDDDQSGPCMALETLSALSQSLPDQHVLTVVMGHVGAAAASGDAAKVTGALRVLGAVVEGLSEALLPKLPELLLLLRSALTSGDLELRRAATATVAEMAEHLQPELAEQHLDQVLPVLLHVLQTPPLDEEGMVAACGAIVDLCHNLTTDDLAPSLAVTVGTLSHVVSTTGGTSPDTRAAALAGLGAVASAAGDEFYPYAEASVALLSSLMGDNGGCMEVRAAATEAMGAVLLAVGPGAVPAAVWERALACAAGGFSLGGTELREAAHRFLGRVAGALDASFAPYLPVALPPALEALAHIGHGEEVGPYRRAVHTGALEEQVASAEALGSYAGATGVAFLPYLGGSLEALDAAVRDPAESLRVAAVRSLEFMLHPVQGAAADRLMGPASTVVGALTRCLEEERVSDIVYSAIVSLETVFTILGAAATSLPMWILARVTAAVENMRLGKAVCQQEHDSRGGDNREQQPARDELEMSTAVERLRGVMNAQLSGAVPSAGAQTA